MAMQVMMQYKLTRLSGPYGFHIVALAAGRLSSITMDVASIYRLIFYIFILLLPMGSLFQQQNEKFQFNTHRMKCMVIGTIVRLEIFHFDAK